MWIYICVRVCVRVCIHTDTHICLYKCIYVCLHTFLKIVKLFENLTWKLPNFLWVCFISEKKITRNRQCKKNVSSYMEDHLEKNNKKRVGSLKFLSIFCTKKMYFYQN